MGATGGSTPTGGSSGTGGALPTGGRSGTGGSTSSGGNPGTGGAPETDGGLGTGGVRSSDGGIVTEVSAADGASCSCTSGGLTWGCYCSVFDCSATLAKYQPSSGLPTSVRAIKEYADCNLVVVTYKAGYDPEVSKVFDLTTGALVGDETAGDVPIRCPFGDGGTVGKLSAGRFPDASCKVTKCTVGPVGGPYCGTGGTGGSPGSGGAGGNPGVGGSTGSGGSRDGGNSSCSCSGMTLDCFCGVSSIGYDCVRTLSTFTSSGGSSYATLEEFADCNLVVVTTNISAGMQLAVYDRSSGQLVGRRYYSDVIERCPFDGTDTGSRAISAGQFPEASCKQTSCIEGSQMITIPCPRS
jgi:hypothetical protein